MALILAFVTLIVYTADGVTIENRTGCPIANAYVVRHGVVESWGADTLAGADIDVLADRSAVTIAPGDQADWARWDLRVVFADGSAAEWHAGTPLAEITVIRVYRRGRGAIYARYDLK